MKLLNKRAGLQLNLPLPIDSAAVVPESVQKELALALVELLISGFRESLPSRGAEDEHESEADC